MRATGLPNVASVSWGTHLCQFYRTRADLVETLVPFFRAGLLNNERCIWVASEPLGAGDAREELGAVVPDLDRRVRDGQIEFYDHAEWYQRSGGSGGSGEVLASWLRCEADALRAGYEGIRISGNIYFLEQAEWRGFAEYEAAAHAAFHGRRVLALCSYSLDRCAPEQILDVLRNHRFALVRRENAWQPVHSATFLLSGLEEPQFRHVVRFYEDRDGLPAARIAEFLGAEHAIVIATRPHQQEILAAMSGHAGRRVQLLDAEELAGKIVVNGQPSRQAFDELVTAAVDEAIKRFGRVRAYGEIVDLLCRDADHASAARVEAWWSEVVASRPIEILCAYSISSFYGGQGSTFLPEVCGEHGSVEQVGSVALTDSGRALADLQRRAAMMSRHFARLQELTSSLSEASSREELAAMVGEHLFTMFGADRATLLLPTEDGRYLRMHGSINVDDASLAKWALVPIDGALPGPEAFRTGMPRWLSTPEAIEAEYPGLTERAPEVASMVMLPLTVAGRRLGVLALANARPRDPSLTEHALLEDYAKQVALALDRAHGYERAQAERERAEAANRTKDEFLAMLGHGLRNPLAPIQTALQLMRLRDGDALTSERAIIERQINHMVRLVDDLLDVSRITQGKVELKRAPIELSRVVAQSVEIVSPILEERAHRLSTSVPTHGLVIDVDAHRLAQAVANILTNAAKYTPPRGLIDVIASATPDRVRLSVRDNGVGMEAELLPFIFDQFVQGKQSPDLAQGGLGLGLAIARSLVELHGGRLQATSEGPGRGSEFTIELPRVLGRSAAPSRNKNSKPAKNGAGVRVLVVDDNHDAAALLAGALEAVGHKVRIANDGPSALELAAEFRPHLALVDLGLPIMDGFELARRLQEDGVSTKLIAVTGFGRESDRRRSKEAGFAYHFLKPVDFARLDETIRRLCPIR